MSFVERMVNDMKNKYLRLTLSERKSIEQSLKIGASLSSVARNLKRSKGTISREIVRNSVYRKTGGSGTVFNNCVNRSVCEEGNLCIDNEYCKRIKCCSCNLCFYVCKKYIRETCLRLSTPPYVCNGCNKLKRCTLEKCFYKAHIADKSANSLLKISREGVNLSEDECSRLNDIVSPLIKNGQSPWHICKTQKDLLMISDKTLYRYISANLFDVKDTNLERKVKMKPRKKKQDIKIEKACREGRTYRDFLTYIEKYPDIEVVQMDTVIGKKGANEKVLLTIHFPNSHFMLAFIRDANTARSVTESFDIIKRNLGHNRFEGIFPLILTDNGPEFSNPSAIELDTEDNEIGPVWTKIYYCDPYSPYQKGAIEAGHRFIRKILPKGTSMNTLNQEDINLMMSHINSYARNSLGGLTPIEMFSKINGNTMAKMLGIKSIPFNEINLTPTLLK